MKTLLIVTCLSFVGAALGEGYKPKDGYVPDARTAMKIAEAVLVPVYGERKIESERPFSATLKDGVWTVAGTLYCGEDKRKATDCDGGVAEVRISRDDGRILYLWHGK